MAPLWPLRVCRCGPWAHRERVCACSACSAITCWRCGWGWGGSTAGGPQALHCRLSPWPAAAAHGGVCIFHLGSCKRVATLAAHAKNVRSLAYDATHNLLLTCRRVLLGQGVWGWRCWCLGCARPLAASECSAACSPPAPLLALLATVLSPSTPLAAALTGRSRFLKARRMQQRRQRQSGSCSNLACPARTWHVACVMSLVAIRW